MAGNGALENAEKKTHTNKGTCAQFLRDNPRFLNEPIRYLLPGEKSTSVAECLEWIKDKDEDRPTIRPSLQSNSPQVKVAQPVVSPSKRHVYREAASGIAPGVADSKQPLVEKISFRHAYDSRADPNEPIRGKLHGNFVWAEKK
eukprot:Em0014g686a